MGQEERSGVFEDHLDIGEVRHAGKTEHNPQTDTYTITAAGTNIWGTSDEFHFAWKSIQGDFILRAHVAFVGGGVNPHRKLGWMVRENLRPDAAHLSGNVHGDGLSSLQWRPDTASEILEIQGEVQAPEVIQLERRGNRFTFSMAKEGQPWTSITKELELDNELLAGLFVCSHEADVLESARFWNVRFIKPERQESEAYEDYLGSRLEILDTKTGLRKVLLHSAHSIQAPNWTPDGRTLIYNSNGYLYTFDLESGAINVLDTGFANRNNNDHVLSANGKYIAISHHNEADSGASSIYYLPIEGSPEPIKVTRDGVGPSYLHGWSADRSTMLFTGSRNGQYDIYAVDVDTGAETQLTDQPGLDDGSEYSPDGKWIYFNSNRTGTMQIWRMRPDGSDQEQLTFDAYQDWFPHVSPDGSQVVMITYPKEVPSGDHPFYKHCMLRIMPAEGGPVKALAYVYGGQGTINVPSWSPDGRYLAFVSNSD